MQVLLEREPELRDHHVGVSVLALEVGRQLGMTSEELDETARAAELHDIGKMAIPDEILNKPARLTEEEYAFMKQHTVIPERIIAAAPAMAGVARIVRASHERFDGPSLPGRPRRRGHPAGRPDCQRLRLVRRDDHPAVLQRAAHDRGIGVAELRRCAGSRFDPAVVNAFAQVVAPADAASSAG